MAAESFEEVMRHSREMLEKLDRLNKDPEFQKELQEEFAFMNTPEYEIKLAEEFFDGGYVTLWMINREDCATVADDYKGTLETANLWKKEYAAIYNRIQEKYAYYCKTQKAFDDKYRPKYVP